MNTSQNALVLCTREMSFGCLKDQGVLSKGTYTSWKKSGRSKRRWRLLRKLHRLCETALENRKRWWEGQTRRKEVKLGRKTSCWLCRELLLQWQQKGFRYEDDWEVFKGRCCNLWGMRRLSSGFQQKLGSGIWAETGIWSGLISLPNLGVWENSSYG